MGKRSVKPSDKGAGNHGMKRLKALLRNPLVLKLVMKMVVRILDHIFSLMNGS